MRLGLAIRDKLASRDEIAAKLGARQHGVVTSAQLAKAGINRDAILRGVNAGRLHRIHRGVYAVGHSALSPHGRWMAAVLALGPNAVLSHRSAAELLALLPLSSGSISVTIPGTGGRTKRPGIRIHRSLTLVRDQIWHRQRIPLTGPSRTIADLRRVVSTAALRRAKRQAEYLGLPLEGPTDRTRSDPEAEFLALCRRHRIPAPEVNVEVGPFTVDFLWRQQRVAVETDAWSTHRGEQAFEDDHERDLYLRRMGLRVARFSYGQLLERSATVAADLRGLLKASRR